MFDTKLTNNLPTVSNPMPFSMNNRWGGNYPWMPNFKFPTNPLAQASSPHTTKADAQGIQQAMQKRSEQERVQQAATAYYHGTPDEHKTKL